MKRIAQSESDLDILQENVENLADSLSDIVYLNQDLERDITQLNSLAGDQKAFPLPDANEQSALPDEGDGMQIAASKLFSRANKGGLRKVQRSAKQNLSFAPHELREAQNLKEIQGVNIQEGMTIQNFPGMDFKVAKITCGPRGKITLTSEKGKEWTISDISLYKVEGEGIPGTSAKEQMGTKGFYY
jgi:hypothetical protein